MRLHQPPCRPPVPKRLASSTIFRVYSLLDRRSTFSRFYRYARWVPTTPFGNLKWEYFNWPRRRTSRWGHFYCGPITSYSKASPSGSFSSNQVSAASEFANTLRWVGVSDLLAHIEHSRVRSDHRAGGSRRYFPGGRASGSACPGRASPSLGQRDLGAIRHAAPSD